MHLVTGGNLDHGQGSDDSAGLVLGNQKMIKMIAYIRSFVYLLNAVSRRLQAGLGPLSSCIKNAQKVWLSSNLFRI